MSLADSLRTSLQSVSQSIARRQLARWQALLPKVASYEEELQKLSAYDMRKRSLSLRYRLKSHEPAERIMPEAFALVREAGRRTLNMRHFDVQILGGIAMHNRSIAEMQTGEGKTLTATLPLYLAALEGKGAHLATVNDYLARRDAEWMTPLYESLGKTSDAKPISATSPTARPRSLASIFFAIDCCCGELVKDKPTFWAPCWECPARGASDPCNARPTSC
jgi:preprotein translocase subunit SecA